MLLTPRLIAGVFLFAGVGILVAVQNWIILKMAERINERSPEDRKVSCFGWHYLKYRRLTADYEELYPHGKLASYLKIAFVLTTALGIALFFVSGLL